MRHPRPFHSAGQNLQCDHIVHFREHSSLYWSNYFVVTYEHNLSRGHLSFIFVQVNLYVLSVCISECWWHCAYVLVYSSDVWTICNVFISSFFGQKWKYSKEVNIVHCSEFVICVYSIYCSCIWLVLVVVIIYSRLGVIHKGRPQNISQNLPSLPPCPLLSALTQSLPLRTSAPDYRSRGYWTWPLCNKCLCVVMHAVYCLSWLAVLSLV